MQQSVSQQKFQRQEQQIKRSLNRLCFFLNKENFEPCIPAFYYSADLLKKHATNYGEIHVNGNLFHEFKKQLQNFALKDLTHLKPSLQQIFKQTLQLAQEETFMNCMRPDIVLTRKTISLPQRNTHLSYISQMSHHKKINSHFDQDIRVSQQKNNFYNFNGNKFQNFTEKEVLEASSNYKFGIPDSVINQGVQNSRKMAQSSKILEQPSQSFFNDELPIDSKISIQKNQHNKQIGQQLKQLWSMMKTAYEQHRIDQAQKISREFSKKSQNHSKLKLKEKHLIETIELEYETMTSFYKEFDTPGWIFDKQENGIKLQYKLFEEAKQISIKIQGQFDVPVENFLAIVSQVGLMGQYVPFCYDSKLLKEISRNQKIATSKIYIPMLTDRETYFYATGYDRLTVTNSIFFYSKTINQDYQHHKRYGYEVPKYSDFVRLQYKFFIIEYIPLGKTRARVRLASNIDMKLNFLPNFILSVSARRFAFDYFKNIIKINNNFKGSEWQKQVLKKPEFYGFFKRKNQEYLSKGTLKS